MKTTKRSFLRWDIMCQRDEARTRTARLYEFVANCQPLRFSLVVEKPVHCLFGTYCSSHLGVWAVILANMQSRCQQS